MEVEEGLMLISTLAVGAHKVTKIVLLMYTNGVGVQLIRTMLS